MPALTPSSTLYMTAERRIDHETAKQIKTPRFWFGDYGDVKPAFDTNEYDS